jgi:hypothetical protein
MAAAALATGATMAAAHPGHDMAPEVQHDGAAAVLFVAAAVGSCALYAVGAMVASAVRAIRTGGAQ